MKGAARLFTFLGLLGLCLVLGNQPVQAMQPVQPFSPSGSAAFTEIWFDYYSGGTTSVAWGDYDNDGDLDLAVGNDGLPNKVYENVGGTLQFDPAQGIGCQISNWDSTTSVAWGDYDNDGDLDLAVGFNGAPAKVYENVGGTLQFDPGNGLGWESAIYYDFTYSVAWGDYDGDSDLDLAVGNRIFPFYPTPSRVYRNENGTLPAYPTWSAPIFDETTSVAWGDYDNDGDLDLAVGNDGSSNKVYEYVGGTEQFILGWQADIADSTYSIAWGDYDNDGDLDLAVGNYGPTTGRDRVYENDGSGTLQFDPDNGLGWQSPESVYYDGTRSVAWGDYDNDGDLDLAVGNDDNPNKIYENVDGAGQLSLAWMSGAAATYSIAWSDYDGDGYLDLAAGNYFGSNRLYHNDGIASMQFDPPNGLGWESPYSWDDYPTSLAWGDYDNDGDLDLAIGNGGNGVAARDKVYENVGGTLQFDPGNNVGWQSVISDSTTSVAWGDYDGDGDLDLATGNDGQPNRVYENEGGTLQFDPGSGLGWQSDITETTTSVAWGDYDNDGDLDLAVGNLGTSNKVYENVGGTLQFDPGNGLGWESALYYYYDFTYSVAWGDYDNDGDLDLALSGWETPNRIYKNVGGTEKFILAWQSSIIYHTHSLAWGDYDGDGDLDLAAGNHTNEPNIVYENVDGTMQFDPPNGEGWQSKDGETTFSVAWGDYDNDGDLDLAAGNAGDYDNNKVYENVGGTLQFDPAKGQGWQSDNGRNSTQSIAWGDYDNDGDLDLAAANWWGYNRVFENVSHSANRLAIYIHNLGNLTPTYNGGAASALDPAAGYALSWIREKGAIPLFYTLTTSDAANQILSAEYSLNGGGLWSPAVTADGAEISPNALLFDGIDDYVDIPDNPDLQPANFTLEAWIKADAWPDAYSIDTILGKDDGIYEGGYALSVGENGRLWFEMFCINDWPRAISAPLMLIGTWYHVAGVYDGATLTALINGVPVASAACSATNPSMLPLRIGDSPRYTDRLFAGSIDEVRLWNAARTPAQIQADMNRQVANSTPGLVGYWRLDELSGAVAHDQTPHHYDGALFNGPRRVMGAPLQNLFEWDVVGSDFFGESDNVVVRLTARPDPRPQPYSIAGSYQRASISTTTFPLRVRGQQVRVMQDGNPVQGAEVHQIPVGQSQSVIIGDLRGQPYHTDSQGYLQGRGQLKPGDQLLALAPITATETYTLYYTSAAPNVAGLDAFTVLHSGVQTLAITSTHPLLLFDLDVSLEWDATQDQLYLDQLKANLLEASDYLYDFTNGQVALGKIRVHQNRDYWDTAHIVVMASNRLRPWAVEGGIIITNTVMTYTTATFSNTLTFAPGQVAIGAVWNRYGNPGQSMGEDWPLVLAHELSHYLFFLDDVYMGIDPQSKQLIPVNTCQGSAMGDLYSNPDNSEFIYDAEYWDKNCKDTLANKMTGMTEWDVLHTWYPDLVPPTLVPTDTNPGPASLTFDFTQARANPPYTSTAVLVDPTFLIYQGGRSASPAARAYLEKPGKRMINLGSPFGGQNRVQARGAELGDRLCVFDPTYYEFGCEIITLGDDALDLRQDLIWNPVVALSPISTKTLDISVTLTAPLSESLYVRLFPAYGLPYAAQRMEPSGRVYTVTLPLSDTVLSGMIQVYVSETVPTRREAILPFSVGGNPGYSRSSSSGGGFLRGPGYSRSSSSGGGGQRSGNAPILSPDGNLIYFTQSEITFTAGTLFSIQAMAGLPELPPGRLLVGQAYRILASQGVTLPVGSVSLQYAQNDVSQAGVREEDLRLYYHDGRNWQELNTQRDEFYNLVSAPSEGAGIYALLASTRIPLYGPGWNNFSYPLRETQPITLALESISGTFTSVYAYEPGAPGDPWLVYDATTPPEFDLLVNDLRQLEFGRGYWIYITATETITAYFGGVRPGAPLNLALPPATYYGLAPGSPGQAVTAWVGGTLCGQGLTRPLEIGGEMRTAYVLHVAADGPSSPGCGAEGQVIVFKIVGQEAAWQVSWQNERSQRLDLGPPRLIFMPVLRR